MKLSKGGVTLAIGLLVLIIAIEAGAFTASSLINFSGSFATQMTFKDKELMEDKIRFDSEKRFLENGLFVGGGYATYLNGLNGTMYNAPWPRSVGTDTSGRPYDHTCWKFISDAGPQEEIPPIDLVESQLREKLDDTYKSYITLLEYTEVEDIWPLLDTKIDNNQINLSYGITNLTLSNDFLSHKMEERGVWINTTLPLRYFQLHTNGSDFTQNTETRLDDKLIAVLDYVKVCKGLGQLTEVKAEELIEEELQEITTDESENYGGIFDWEMHLLEINYFKEEVTGPPHQYYINYTINVTVMDGDKERRVVTEGNLKKLGITFSINSDMTFWREVDYLCEMFGDWTGKSNCGPKAGHCVGSIRYYYDNDGTTTSGSPGDCSEGSTCYCERTDDCSPGMCCGGSCCANCCNGAGTGCCAKTCCGSECCDCCNSAGTGCCSGICCSGNCCSPGESCCHFAHGPDFCCAGDCCIFGMLVDCCDDTEFCLAGRCIPI